MQIKAGGAPRQHFLNTSVVLVLFGYSKGSQKVSGSTRLHYFQLLSVSLSTPPEKYSRYHPRTALVPFLFSQRPFPVPLGYPPPPPTHTHPKGLKRCSTGKKTSQILFSLASFLLMSSDSCKRMSRDQIQKQPTVRASLLVGTRRCHKLYTRAQNVAPARAHTHTRARANARTHGRTHVHTHKHTHTTTLFPIALCLPSPAPEKLSRYHPRTALVTIHAPL